MTTRPAKGGRIPPDGRPPQAKGVGENARRHDLEIPATPGLHGSDLQQGDVQRLTAAQRIAPTPKRNQPPATGGGRRRVQSPRRKVGRGPGVPDPIELAHKRLGGTLSAAPRQLQSFDTGKWAPLLQRLGRAPGTGGVLRAAIINQLSNLQRRPVAPQMTIVDLQDLEDKAAAFFGVD